MNRPHPSFLLLTLAIVCGCLSSACTGGEAAPAESATPASPTVSVLTVQPESVHVTSEWVATLDGMVNAQIRPQVSGYLIRKSYREGGSVRQGEVLFEIDPRTFESALAQAEAQLAQARAQLGRAEQDVNRDRPLAAERAIAQSQLDNDIQANLAAQAAVKLAEAQVETARLNLSFTKVRSLVNGVAAIATAQIGDLVGPNTLLTTVSQVQPIRAYFSLSEREYLGIAPRLNARGQVRSLWSTASGLTLTLADGQAYPHPGTFLAADRQIDPTTGTIRLSATFPNPDNQLRPGQHGRISADTRVDDQALLVPQRAVTDLQGTPQVRIVGSDDTVQVRNLTLGERVGPRWIVSRGLEPGDRVIVDSGQIVPGTKVETRPFTGEQTGARTEH